MRGDYLKDIISLVLTIIFTYCIYKFKIKHSKFKTQFKFLALVNLICITLSIILSSNILYIIGYNFFIIGLFIGIIGLNNKVEWTVPILVFIFIFLFEQVVGYTFNIEFLKSCIINNTTKTFPLVSFLIPLTISLLLAKINKENAH